LNTVWLRALRIQDRADRARNRSVQRHVYGRR
jgi:hypothetical protein